MIDNREPDPAKRRFFIIQALRLSGVAMVMTGMLIFTGKIALPAAAGYVLAVIGLIDALIMPTVLSRKWKTPLP